MPIVFDEVIAEVAPSQPPQGRDQQAGSQPAQQPELIEQLRQLDRRAERVRAD
jgi:hypothetical protein